MVKPREFCPRCQALRNMAVTVRQPEETDSQEQTEGKVVRIYHCETCGSFVRSESTEGEEDSLEQEPTNGREDIS